MKRWALLCGVMLLFAGITSAQDDKVMVFGGYSYVHADTTGLVRTSTSFHGGSGSIAYKPIPLVSVVADFGGYHWNGSGALAGADATLFSYLFGPKVDLKIGPVTPFVQSLFGGTHLSACGGGCLSENAFSMTLGGGLDWYATRHIGVRLIQAEYYMTRFSSQTQNNARISAGVAFRF